MSKALSTYLTLAVTLFGLVSNLLAHEMPLPNDNWTTIGTQKYQILSLGGYYAYSTTEAGSEFRLLPVSQVKPDMKPRIITSVIDQYCLRIGISYKCHKLGEKGIEFNRDCCDSHTPGLKFCNHYPHKHFDMDLESKDFSEMNQRTVRDTKGEEYYVITVLKNPECPSLLGTLHFPDEPVPYGLKLLERPENRLFVLCKCYAVAAAILLPFFYFIDLKGFLNLATTLK